MVEIGSIGNEVGGPGSLLWTVIVGRRLLIDLVCGETQEEHKWNFIRWEER